MSDNEDADKLGSIVFPRSLLKKFIRKYEEFPCLWDKNCLAYKDRFQRREAVAQLTELLREYNPTATRVHVLRKIESLRSCMRREHNRVIDSRMKAETPEEVYKPILWYYNLLSFVFAESDVCFVGYHGQEKSLAEEENVVALIFGVHGACRGNELLKITVDDVEIHSDDLLLVKLKDTKTKMDRSFVIRGEYKTIVQKYLDLRPADMETNRFFIRYQNGKCCKQVIGKNKIANMPQEIATYLKLPDTKLYTGHCFRRTSATLLANSGADLTALTRHGGWKSSAVAEGFIEDSIENKAKTVTIKNVSNDSGDDISNQEENSYGTTETFVQGGQHCSPSSSHSDQVKASTHGIRETGVKHLYPHDNILEVSVLPNTPYSVQDNGESTVKRLCTRIDDEYDAIGVNVAAKLRSLPFNMRVLAEKLINDVLFQAQINGLSPSTTITNPDLVKQDPLNN